MAALAAALEGQWGEAHRCSGHRMLLWGTLGAVPVLCWGPLSPPEVTVCIPADRRLNRLIRLNDRSKHSHRRAPAGDMSVSAYHLQPQNHTMLGQQMHSTSC